MPKAEKIKHCAVRNGREVTPEIYRRPAIKRERSQGSDDMEPALEDMIEADGAIHSETMFTDTDSQAQIEGWIPPLSSSGSESSQPKSVERFSATSLTSEGTQESDSTPSQAAPIMLSLEQKRVLKMVEAGKNVFFTGSAGTGKSILLREIIRCCRKPSPERPLEPHKQVGVTAATGIASVNIGGTTIHSWAGIGLGKESAPVLAGTLLGIGKPIRDLEKEIHPPVSWTEIGRIHRYIMNMLRKRSLSLRDSDSRAIRRWHEVKSLVIDEISMLDGALFDKLEFIARILRRNQLPFGGIQLVLSGDFCQLPPVPDRQNGVDLPVAFAFEAKSWNNCIGKPVVLHRVFRQKDKAFVDMLNVMRLGYLDYDTVENLRKLERPVVYDDDIEPTELYPTRDEVETANITRLKRLKSDPYVYNAIDVPGFDDAGKRISVERMQKAVDRLVAQKSVTLKEGAQVMLIKNLVQGELVNGSIGRVVGFSTCREALDRHIKIAITEVEEEEPELQFPRFRKAPKTEEDRIPKVFLKSKRVWPVVRFPHSQTIICLPSSFEVNNADGLMEARREQIPLILAWALSIHKSQGQTLERVRVNLRRIFVEGQAYVALSRATSMETLEVVNFNPDKIKAHDRVLKWLSKAIGDDNRTQEQIDDDAEYWSE